jgi:AhpD family alkylhydroperoxidase
LVKGGIHQRKEKMTMNRHEVYKEIEEMFSFVPTFFKSIPDSTLELEWKLFKRVQFDPSPIPNKYRELIGLAISAVTKCRYCTLFHTEVAKLSGATDAEIEDAVHYAKSSAGWSTYLNGLQIDYDQFKNEVIRACDYVRSKMGTEKELRCRDIGADCDYVIRGKTEGEIFDKASEHAKTVHNMKEFPSELMEKARTAIHSVA